MRIALTIAGSDSSGGAGIQADLKAFSVLGVYGASALTAVTAQNTTGVSDAMELPAEMVQRQIDAVVEDFHVDACKTGMLSSAAIVVAVADRIARHNLRPYVCDPVMVAKSGARLLQPDAIEAMRSRLFPLAAVLTPNLRETAALLGRDTIDPTSEAAHDAARRLLDIGAGAVVIKALPRGRERVDLLYDGHAFTEFSGPAHDDRLTHGSGCTFSAAITAGLASGLPLLAAVEQAQRLTNLAIAHSAGLGKGTAPVNVLAYLEL